MRRRSPRSSVKGKAPSRRLKEKRRRDSPSRSRLPLGCLFLRRRLTRPSARGDFLCCVLSRVLLSSSVKSSHVGEGRDASQRRRAAQLSVSPAARRKDPLLRRRLPSYEGEFLKKRRAARVSYATCPARWFHKTAKTLDATSPLRFFARCVKFANTPILAESQRVFPWILFGNSLRDTPRSIGRLQRLLRSNAKQRVEGD